VKMFMRTGIMKIIYQLIFVIGEIIKESLYWWDCRGEIIWTDSKI